MSNSPVSKSLVDTEIEALRLKDFSKATIREIVAISSSLEKKTGVEFIHMEMGIPGLPPSKVGVEAEKKALDKGVASIYPPIDGIPELKQEASRFVKAFIDVDIDPKGCIPVTGSMQGTFASFLTALQMDKKRDTILFIDPGFPVQKQQIVVMGYKYITFDVYDFRGDALEEKLESYLSQGNIAAIVYSNPNNPSWICFTEKELEIIGKVANKNNTIILEDLAYFSMDFRKNLGTPFMPPFQVSVAKYARYYALLISGSKAFSYAGQRIGVVCIGNELFNLSGEGYEERYGGGCFGTIFSHRVLYALSSGTSHSAQYAMTAMMKSASDGEYHFLEDVSEYGRRAKRLKEIFQKHGFHIVYDKDMEDPVADGFYFTIGYKKMTGGELMYALMMYGVSAINLSTMGSTREGLRICTSFIKPHQYDLLEERLRIFETNY